MPEEQTMPVEVHGLIAKSFSKGFCRRTSIARIRPW